MQVRRDGLAGAIRSQAPDAPCTHYFEKAATGTTDGIACGEDGGTCIGTQQCRFGYCEEY